MLSSPDRRRFIRSAGGLLLAGAALLALSPDSDQPATPTSEVSTKDWREIALPSLEAVTPISLQNLSTQPPIGLRELYLVTTDKIPLVVICSIWDNQTNKDETKSKFKLGGRIGFHPISEPFNPKPELIEGHVKITSEQAKEMPEFMARTIMLLDAQTSSRILSEPIKLSPTSRPAENLRFALIFEAAVTEYRDQPSPLSYLPIRFRFDQMPPSKNPLI